ncbi:hypothetical protein BOX15_Mlig015892g1, partial [Macrostomum lignano]
PESSHPGAPAAAARSRPVRRSALQQLLADANLQSAVDGDTSTTAPTKRTMRRSAAPATPTATQPTKPIETRKSRRASVAGSGAGQSKKQQQPPPAKRNKIVAAKKAKAGDDDSSDDSITSSSSSSDSEPTVISVQKTEAAAAKMPDPSTSRASRRKLQAVADPDDNDFQDALPAAAVAPKKARQSKPQSSRQSKKKVSTAGADKEADAAVSKPVIDVDWSQALNALEDADDEGEEAAGPSTSRRQRGGASPRKSRRSCIQKTEVQASDGDDDEDDDWEEVADAKDGGGSGGGAIEVLVGAPARKDAAEQARRRHERLLVENLHKVHFLVLLARCQLASRLANDQQLRAVCLSRMPADLCDALAAGPALEDLRQFAAWFASAYPAAEDGDVPRILRPSLTVDAAVRCAVDSHVGASAADLRALLAVCHLRACGVRRCRFVSALRVLPIRLTKAAMAQREKEAQETQQESVADAPEEDKAADDPDFGSEAGDFVDKKRSKDKNKKPATKTPAKKQQTDKTKKTEAPKPPAAPSTSGLRRSGRAKSAPLKPPPPSTDSASGDSSAEDVKPAKQQPQKQKPMQNKQRQSVVKAATSAKKARKTTTGPAAAEFWCEVFVPAPEDRWVPLEFNGAAYSIDNAEAIGARIAKPITYVMSVDAEGGVREVTARYDLNWCTKTRKVRAPPAWLEAALSGWKPSDAAFSAAEDRQLTEMLLKRPEPSRPEEFRGHPLYALRRHLLKYEVIYPDEAEPMGFVRPSNEPFYSRDCVHVCHTRETWLKEARVVRPGEQPVKVVKSRMSAKQRLLGNGEPASVDLFGHWQTQPYEPPIAVNGRVPRNEHGNVDLFKPCMLPRGCVHLKLPGLVRLAKKLGVDGVPAMTGWEFKGAGWARPVLEGLVVCAENRRLLIDAWLEERRAQRERAVLAKSERAEQNWRRLAKGLLMRAAIRAKYLT